MKAARTTAQPRQKSKEDVASRRARGFGRRKDRQGQSNDGLLSFLLSQESVGARGSRRSAKGRWTGCTRDA